MATFVLIHGGGGSAWDWHLLVPELAGRGHDVVVPELPIEDRSAGFAEFCEAVVNAIGDRSDLVVVGHSYGGFIAPLIADKLIPETDKVTRPASGQQLRPAAAGGTPPPLQVVPRRRDGRSLPPA